MNDFKNQNNSVKSTAICNYENHPLQGIDFYKYKFFFNHFVLKPRSDSELLVEFIVKRFKKQKLFILDLGTGSGCLICSILMQLPFSTAIAIDISQQALNICKLNIKHLSLEERITLIRNNWLTNHNTSYDLLVSNPPYLSLNEIQHHKLFNDPTIALLGDLSFYKAIAIKKHLFKYIILEINPIHLNQLKTLFTIEQVIYDYVNLPRFIFINNT